MKHTGAFSVLVFSLFLWSCGGDSTPTAPTPTPTPTPVATSITLSEASLSFTSLGATSQLSATVKDQNGATMSGATVTWSSSDDAVATVSSTGLVTSILNGTATIIGMSGSLGATASVTVAAPSFFLAANGVTVMCSGADVGDTGTVGGVIYTKRSKAQIDALVAAENYASLATTCTSGVTDMKQLFYHATSFNGDISSWDVSSVTTMREMFDEATAFNQDIGSWNVSSVMTMSEMFYRARAFNQDLSGWCVSLITFEPYYFDAVATSWIGGTPRNRPVWGTCPS